MAALCCWPLLVLLAGGCGDPYARPVAFSDLASQDPILRIRAIKWAGDNEIERAVPPLVDSLESQDEAVRFYAIEALRRIVGDDYDYDYKAHPRRRATAVERWQALVASKEWDDGEH